MISDLFIFGIACPLHMQFFSCEAVTDDFISPAGDLDDTGTRIVWSY